jgi:hypothetical protein
MWCASSASQIASARSRHPPRFQPLNKWEAESDLKTEILVADHCVRFYEASCRERLAQGGLRKAAWALGQLRISRAHADRLRALQGRVIRPEADGLAAVIELFPRRAQTSSTEPPPGAA